MRSPILSLPVVGPLRPVDWVRPPGNTDMRVTQDAASHASRINPATGLHRPMALDIGDGASDLDALTAPHDCVVAEARTDGSANLALDFVYDGVRWRIVLAHDTLPHPVKVGQVLFEGDAVGRMGNTSSPSMPVALHLHIQVGYWDGVKWVWVDPWPLFAQNQPIGGDMIQGKILGPQLVNQVVTVEAKDTNFRAAPATGATPKLAQFPAGYLFYPDYLVEGQAVPAGGSKRWFAGFGDTAKGVELGYLHESVVSDPVPAQVAGHTDAELAQARLDAAQANEAKWETWVASHP
jgi:hypothetical protein